VLKGQVAIKKIGLSAEGGKKDVWKVGVAVDINMPEGAEVKKKITKTFNYKCEPD